MTRPRIFRVLCAIVGLSVVPGGLPIRALSQTPAPAPPNPTADEQELDRLREGIQAYYKGKFSEAEKAWRAGLEKAQARNDERMMAEFLSSLGNVHWSLGQLDKALEHYTRALSLCEKLGNDQDIATNLRNLGLVYNRLDQLDKALEYHTRALALYEKLGNDQDIATSLNNLGGVYNRLGQLDKVLECRTRALALYEKRGNGQRIADSLNDLGLVYQALGQLDKALEHYTRALALYEKLGDQPGIARSLNNLGVVYQDLGQSDKALEYHTLALALYEKLGNGQRIADSLNNLGNVYWSLGQLDKALEHYTRALALNEKLGNEQSIADSLNNLGSVYQDLGQLDKALEYRTRTLALYERLGDQPGIARSLDNLGNVYRDLDQLDKALGYHTRALALYEKLGNQQDIATSLNNLGVVYRSLGQLDKALQHYLRALALYEKLGNAQDIATSLNNLGNVYQALSQLDKALEYQTRALALREKLGNQQDIATSLSNLGVVYWSLGQLDQAEIEFAKAIQHYEALREQIGEGTQVGAFQEASQRSLYALCAYLLTRRKRPAEALALLERGRGRGLALQAAQTSADLAHLIGKQDAARWKAAADTLTAADRLREAAQQRQERAAPAQQSAAQIQFTEAQRRYEVAERERILLRAELYRRYPEYRRLRGAAPPTVEQLKTLARQNPDTLYLEWATGDDKNNLLFALSHRDGFQAFTLLVGDEELSAETAAWRKALTIGRVTAAETKAAKTLFRALFSPLQQAGLLKPGRYARLVLVPDGPLLDIPFAALMDAAGKRLIERYALSTSVSLGMLTWPANPRKPTGTMLCAADPTGPKGERFPKGVQAAALRGTEEPLPHAREEGKQVAHLFPGAVGLAGPEAREAEVKRRMGRYALLHFATHGELNERAGLHSWLKFAPEKPESAENGLLEAREIVGLPLSARLAVLSACESGRGQRSGGEGLLGLAWAFRAAGCPSIVASQWRVNDVATERLMVAFYRNLKAGKRRDDALRAPMLQIQRQPGYRGPYYWSAFQLIGEAGPPALPR